MSLLLAAGVQAGEEAREPPAVHHQCVTIEGDLLRVRSVAEDRVASCRGELFGAGEGLWLHRPAPGSIEAPAAKPVPEAGGVVRLALVPPFRSTLPLPRAFLATVLQEGGNGVEERIDRLLCRAVAPRASRRLQDARYLADCPAPTGEQHLRIDLPELGTTYLWDLRVAVGETVQKEVRLYSGVELIGTVNESDVEPRLLIRAEDLGDLGRVFASKLGHRSDDGEVLFDAVAPGAYRYEIEAADGRSAHAPVVVPVDRTRLTLPDLTLPSLAILSVQLSPPLDGVGEPWKLRLVPRPGNPHRSSPISLAADSTGWQELPPVESGPYLLLVEDAEGSLWLTEELDLGADTTLWFDLPSVTVEGRAKLGDDPFVGELIFGGTYGERSFSMTTDEEGEFAGLLPEEGEWEVEIRSSATGCAPCDDSPGALRLAPVEVEVGASGKAWVEIDIPNTRLAGRVVVADQKSSEQTSFRLQPGASVFVTRVSGPADDRGRQAQIWTDDGEFELVGLASGDLMIAAMHSELGYESGWEILRLVEGEESSPVELVLEPKRALRARIVAPSGPVGGALVNAFVPDGKSARSVSGPNGALTLELARRAAGTLLVEAAGFGTVLQPFRQPMGATTEEPVLVEVTSVSGDLSLRAAPYDVFSEGSLVSAKGGILPLRVLAGLSPASVSFGESLVIRGLAPGTYYLCTERGDCWEVEVFAGVLSTIDLSEES